MSNVGVSKKNKIGFIEFIEEIVGTNLIKEQILLLKKSEITIYNQAECSIKKLKIIERSISINHIIFVNINPLTKFTY
jgi:hypothetical protein